MSSDEIWYFLKGQESKGPFSKDVLKQIYDGGQLTPDTLVWREGMAGWLAAKNVPEMDFLKPVGSAPAAAATAGAAPSVAAPSPHGKLKLKDPSQAQPASTTPSAPASGSVQPTASADPTK